MIFVYKYIGWVIEGLQTDLKYKTISNHVNKYLLRVYIVNRVFGIRI